MSAPRLMIKQSTGWFAAGWAFGNAMTALSDAAFKVFAWLCLNADRRNGRVRVTVAEIAQALRKTESATQAAFNELVECGVCHWPDMSQVEVADGYWPYEKQPSGSGPQDYLAQVRKLLSEPACVRCRFKAADERLARDLYERGVSLTQLERAIWLGCTRKYMTMLSNQTASSPIASLNYFAAVIDEVIEQSNTSETYWAYIRRQMMTLERQWVTCIRGKTSSSVG
jgi:AraC-like DNA-binding protein